MICLMLGTAIVITVIIALSKPPCKHDWWYRYSSYDQDQILEFKEYHCRKCGKTIRGK